MSTVKVKENAERAVGSQLDGAAAEEGYKSEAMSPSGPVWGLFHALAPPSRPVCTAALCHSGPASVRTSPFTGKSGRPSTAAAADAPASSGEPEEDVLREWTDVGSDGGRVDAISRGNPSAACVALTRNFFAKVGGCKTRNDPSSPAEEERGLDCARVALTVP